LERAKERERLARRNRRLTAFQHQLTWREKLRRELLQAYTWLPKPLRQRPNRGTVLLIRPDHIGDTLLTMPAVQALKAAEPSLRLIGLTGSWSSEVMAAYPEIDMVLTIPFPGFTRQPKESYYSPYLMAWRLAHQVRMLKAETAIIMRPDHWWGALLTYIAGVPRRIGYDHPDVSPFLTDSIPYIPRHAVLQNMKLVEGWTGPVEQGKIQNRFPIVEQDRDYITQLLAANQVPSDRPIVVIHAGAGTPIKQWTPEHWATVADRLTDRLDASVIFTGGDKEHSAIFQIMDRMKRPAISLVGDTNLPQLAALYERATVALGADSGPMHLAVASGTPTVHLYGPADPTEFGPFGDPTRQIVVTTNM
jgi:lipopolysaccharide heptosyltransferase II